MRRIKTQLLHLVGLISLLKSMMLGTTNIKSLPNIFRVIKSRRMRWAGHVARLEKRRDVYRALVGKPEGKRPLRTPRNGWEDNIKMDHQEVYVGAWTGLIWLRIGTGGGHL